MLTHHVRVVIGKRAPIFLEKAKYVNGNRTYSLPNDKPLFISGYQVDKYGEPVLRNGAEIMHLIQLSAGVRVYLQAFNPTYCELEYADPTTGRWMAGISARKARIH